MHLEHIYTQHAKNKSPFTKDGVFDESAFQQTRNLLGMVLLLKDKHNLSSHDEIYADKRDTYSKSNLIWNEMLVVWQSSIDMLLQIASPSRNGLWFEEKEISHGQISCHPHG